MLCTDCNNWTDRSECNYCNEHEYTEHYINHCPPVPVIFLLVGFDDLIAWCIMPLFVEQPLASPESAN